MRHPRCEFLLSNYYIGRASERLVDLPCDRGSLQSLRDLRALRVIEDPSRGDALANSSLEVSQ
eukprot:4552006-Pyramimonas_sp.AAC.1